MNSTTSSPSYGPSRFRGVSHIGGPLNRTKGWRVRVQDHGHQRTVGVYATELEAARAYDAEAWRLHGPSARLNFPSNFTTTPTIEETPTAMTTTPSKSIGRPRNPVPSTGRTVWMNDAMIKQIDDIATARNLPRVKAAELLISAGLPHIENDAMPKTTMSPEAMTSLARLGVLTAAAQRLPSSIKNIIVPQINTELAVVNDHMDEISAYIGE